MHSLPPGTQNDFFARKITDEKNRKQKIENKKNDELKFFKTKSFDLKSYFGPRKKFQKID